MNRLSEIGSNRRAAAAFVCGLVAVVSALVVFWLWLPSMLLGIIAVSLGVDGRRRAAAASVARELAVAAIALGVVAILMTPAVNQIANSERDYGRKCALNPELSEC